MAAAKVPWALFETRVLGITYPTFLSSSLLRHSALCYTHGSTRLLLPSVPSSVPVKYELQVEEASRWILSKFGVFSTNSVPQPQFLSGKAAYLRKWVLFILCLCMWLGMCKRAVMWRLWESVLPSHRVGPVDVTRAVRLGARSFKGWCELYFRLPFPGPLFLYISHGYFW